MSDTLEMTASDAILEARYLRNIADALEQLAERVQMERIPYIAPTTMTEAWAFTQIRLKP